MTHSNTLEMMTTEAEAEVEIVANEDVAIVAVAAAEFGDAADPVLMAPTSHAKTLFVIVQAAAIAHERTAPRRGRNLSQRRDPVLTRHAILPV